MKKVQKQNTEDKKKKRKLLLACLIPTATVAVASAITLPLVLRKKPQSEEYDFVLNGSDGGGYMPDPSTVTLEKNKSYSIKINFNDDHGSFQFDQIHLGITDDGGSHGVQGFSSNNLSAYLNGSETEVSISNEYIYVPEAYGQTSGNLIINFTGDAEDASGDLVFCAS